ncbi:MAG: GGDEF domain-containing protein [Henriciella sp.]|nr:GGDEF domain-containing protein [Henriciella sp.]
MHVQEEHIRETAIFFAIVAMTAITLSFLFSLVMYRLGLPEHPQRFIATSLYIASCVGIPTAVIASQEHIRLISHREVLEELASTDLLTGLQNRRFFSLAANEEIARMARTESTAGLMLFDIDRFKSFNDTNGHSFGDEVLKQIAQITHDELRGPFDRIGRWGGEEFVVLLHDVTAEQVDLVAERIRRRIGSTTVHHEGRSARVTASFGITLMTKDTPFNYALSQADKALYLAKSLGRDRVEFGV